MTLRILIAAVISVALSACASIRHAPLADPDASMDRTVAITIDDLPYVGDSLADATAATERLIAALRRHQAAAAIFVEGRRVEVEGETAARLSLLQQWQAAGQDIANHGFGHRDYNDTPVETYRADVDRGWAIVERVAGADALRQFRAPYNHTGADEAAAAALLAHLDARDMRLTPFTVDHADWMFNAVYEDAIARGDAALAQRVGAAYLDQIDRAFGFAESLAQDTFARTIPQVFLIHANRINADHLDAMLQRLDRRGYRFVRLEQAMRDPVYASDSGHVTRWGYSWLHRWRADRGLPNRLAEEPEPPAWISAAFQALPER
jgi:peptidoglycan/xylan/chitin deacetylase (PgdA/CDA1 family)